MKWIGIASSLALVAMLAQATAPASAQSRSSSHRNLDGSRDIRNSDGSSSRIKRDLSGMGKWLFVGAMVLMVGGIINVFVGSTAGMLVLSTLAIGIFSAFLLYDLKRILDGGETNYISATLALYLSVFNIFQSLLALLGIMGGERD